MCGFWCRANIEVYLGFVLIEEFIELYLKRTYFLSLISLLFHHLLVNFLDINCRADFRSLPDDIVSTNTECFQNCILFRNKEGNIDEECSGIIFRLLLLDLDHL